MPFLVILFKRAIQCSFKRFKIIPRSSTLNNSKEKAKVKPLSYSRVNIIHPAYGKHFFSSSPFVIPFIPYHLRGKVLIKSISNIIISCLSIGFKPSSKSGIIPCIFIKNCLHIRIFLSIKNNRLLIRKMNLKVHNRRNMLLHLKEIEAPLGLCNTSQLPVMCKERRIVDLSSLKSSLQQNLPKVVYCKTA
jgi:hypothetical protein